MYLKKESPVTLLKLEKMWEPFYGFQPKTKKEELFFSQALNTLNDLNSARLQRIYSSWDSLGSLSWLALITGAAVLIFFLFFFGTENHFIQFVISALFITYLIFMIFVIWALDNPFRQPQMIEPRAYEVIYNYYSVTRGSDVSPEETVYLR